MTDRAASGSSATLARLAVLVAIGYVTLGPAYPLYLAVVNGGGLILCGLWMRQA